MEAITIQETRDKKKGMRISIFVHALLLLIAFLYVMPNAKDTEVYPPPVVVDFSFAASSLSKYAYAEEGKKKPKNEKVKEVTKAAPKPVEVKQPDRKVELPTKPKTTPKPTDPIVSTTTTDEPTEIEVVEEDIEIEEPEPEVITEEEILEMEQEAEEAAAEEEAAEAEPIEATPIDATTGTGGNTPGGTDETDNQGSVQDGEEGGTGKGNEGDGPGKTSGNDDDEGVGDGGVGTGDYDDSGDGVFGRRVIKRNWRGLFDGGSQATGKAEVKICVNRAGDVTYTEIIETATTITDRTKLKQILAAARGYKVEADRTAPKEQCGKIKFDLTVNAFRQMNGG